MNVDSTASSGSSGLGGPTSRAQRGAIASQACEMCRSRKQKCDEARPRCGLCNRINVECVYREPQPTKKDKTLTEILNRLMNIEGKIDQISTRRTTQDFGSLRNIPSSQPSFNLESETSSLSTPSSRQQISPTQPYRHASAAHKILSWPALQQLMLQVLPSNAGDFKYLESDGTSFIVRMHSGQPKLPKDEPLQDRPFVGMQSQATRNIGAPRVTFPALTRDAMYRLTAAYFDTFNFLYPFMDRRTFESDTLAKVCSEGFDGDVDSVIALMIFCLGEVAIEGLTGNPIGEYKGLPSGIRGGSDGRPPGLALFNEARKCLGFVLTDSELENVQIFSLFANFLDLDTPRGDLIRRVVWHCIIMETSLHLELDLPLTGILELGDRVGMPSFNVPFCEADHLGNQATNFEAHFASALALRRLGTTINAQIYDSISNTDTPASDEFGGPSATTLKSLAAQLTQWRGLLPRDLQWPEEDPAAFPTPQTGNIGVNDAVDPSLATPRPGRPGSQLFSTDLNSDPMQYRFVYDVQVATLRTRYYYSKFVVYRPFVYKALHFPEQMTQEDAQGVAECLRTCLKWPLTLSPTSRHKRLIPYLFCWSQTFVSILLIFHLTQHNPMLRDIRAQLCGPRFEEDFEVSVALMQDWIRDLKAVDPLALWCYKILQPIYNLDP
ncbi:related to acetate regulatory DNA binding protein FacB [Rhynchosporium agropyri]|uniref:Related to acetate regulatory DNA binding protein FacB n=1 Tax=Rhynchosporium agropyri TaxID=914238 RepID=A0A1E1K916_9HELO|nr:related to acetate regulatory DNA binding protein FacB [Rhynchosporium agropyri]